jgi:cytochrome c-type biogenesis protein
MNETQNISFLVAFTAGFLSFLSPCVLPIIPSYICYITGISFDELKSKSIKVKKFTIFHSLFFILGFSFIFISMGASASFLGKFLNIYRDILRIIGGILIIFFGIYLTGIIKLKFLQRDFRIHLKEKPLGYLGTFIVGIAFACGWTPCIGPILSSILLYAGTKDVNQGIFLLSTYSLGLGLPFFISSLAINTFLTYFNKFKKHLNLVEISSGIFLIFIGILIFTNKFSILAVYLNKYLVPYFPFLKRI